MSEAYIRSSHGVWYVAPGEISGQASVYSGTARGFPVMRCSRCQKIAFNNGDLAEQAAIAIQKRGTYVRPYYMSSCRWWHLTSQGAQTWFVKQQMKDSMAVEIITRDYQQASLDNLYKYFHAHSGNPVLALPTGTGKSIIIGVFLRGAHTQWPQTRTLVLTHVKELIEQNMKHLLKIWPTAPAGIYSAGLKRREANNPITIAGIQSVHGKPELFGHIDLVIIDECHLVSPRSESMYGKFLAALRAINPNLKVIGLSATPYRMKNGMLTDEDGLFDDVAFDLTERDSFNWLIQQGWLSPLIPRKTSEELDVSGVRMQGGEYVLKDLQDHVDQEAITRAALLEAMELAHERKHWLVFASGIAHAEHIAECLQDEFGITAAAVHSKMATVDRDRIIRDFKAGKIQAVVNNNILTTGFDFPGIDCIVMLRPTASPGLWVQMLGRGTRPVFPDGMPLTTAEERLAAIAAGPKQNCLVLDFAGNTQRLGPINDPVLPRKRGKGAPGMAPVRLCEHCMCYSHASCRFCENPECGMEFPRTIKLTSVASYQEIIADSMPKLVPYPVNLVTYTVHKKEDRPDSMRVNYHCGLRRFSEYICLDHGGYAHRVARQWWKQRCQWGVPPSVEAGMAAVEHLAVPTQITVAEKGRYPEICGYEFEGM